MTNQLNETSTRRVGQQPRWRRWSCSVCVEVQRCHVDIEWKWANETIELLGERGSHCTWRPFIPRIPQISRPPQTGWAPIWETRYALVQSNPANNTPCRGHRTGSSVCWKAGRFPTLFVVVTRSTATLPNRCWLVWFELGGAGWLVPDW